MLMKTFCFGRFLLKKTLEQKILILKYSLSQYFFKCLLIEDLFLKSLSQSFFSVLCGSVFKLSQEKLFEALVKLVF